MNLENECRMLKRPIDVPTYTTYTIHIIFIESDNFVINSNHLVRFLHVHVI